MAAKKVDIMELRQLLLLKIKGESNRSCEKLLNIHRNTINHYVRMFRVFGLNYSSLLEHDDKTLDEPFPARELFRIHYEFSQTSIRRFILSLTS